MAPTRGKKTNERRREKAVCAKMAFPRPSGRAKRHWPRPRPPLPGAHRKRRREITTRAPNEPLRNRESRCKKTPSRVPAPRRHVKADPSSRPEARPSRLPRLPSFPRLRQLLAPGPRHRLVCRPRRSARTRRPRLKKPRRTPPRAIEALRTRPAPWRKGQLAPHTAAAAIARNGRRSRAV